MLFQVENLVCRRNLQPVFHNVSFAVDGGGAVLVMGPNGSGKSSLLRVLAGLLPPEQGTVRWGGAEIDWDAHKARLHYIGHDDAAKPELTVAEMLDYWRTLRGASASKPVPAELGLSALMDRPVRVLSAGQQRRLALARLAMDDLPLWLLDEPTTSLDHAGQEALAGLIEKHRAAGGIAVIATHHGMHVPGAQELSLGNASEK